MNLQKSNSTELRIAGFVHFVQRLEFQKKEIRKEKRKEKKEEKRER
jgi:hypothetical protein